MPKKLSETAIVLITTAAARADLKVLRPPKSIRAPAVVVRKTLTALLKDGLLAEVAAARDDMAWEQTEARGRTALVVTEVGLRAVGVEVKPAAKPHTRAKVGKTGRSETKQDIIVRMLRHGGASIAELAEATGWMPHSIRGVLTATIKHRLGLPLVSEKGEDRVRRYHIAALRSGDGEK